MLGQPRFLATKVAENAAILGQPDVFEIKHIYLLGDVVGNYISHYSFLTWNFLDFFSNRVGLP